MNYAYAWMRTVASIGRVALLSYQSPSGVVCGPDGCAPRREDSDMVIGTKWFCLAKVRIET